MSPYTVHAAGSAQYTHRHHTGIICTTKPFPFLREGYLSRDDEAGEDVPEDEDEERQAHGDLDVWGQRHRHHPVQRVVHEAHHQVQEEPQELARRQLEPDHRVHDPREDQHLHQHVRLEHYLSNGVGHGGVHARRLLTVEHDSLGCHHRLQDAAIHESQEQCRRVYDPKQQFAQCLLSFVLFS